MSRPHDWTVSRLGHGEAMCRRCFITNREAAVLGKLAHCDVAEQPPATNSVESGRASALDAPLTDANAPTSDQ